MSLTSALYTANSALTASQIGLSVTSQNLSNAATPGYTRQVARLEAVRGRISDPNMIGSGVAVQEVRRQIDESLRTRLWNAESDEFGSAQRRGVFDQLETILNEGTEFDLSSELAGFFDVWSEATTLADSSSTLRNQGRTLAGFMRNMRSDLMDQRAQIEAQIDAQVKQADSLFSEIASINGTISNRELGSTQASALRDRRDNIITELSQLMDVTVSENNQGSFDVYVGSTPIVQGTVSRGITVDRVATDEGLTARVAVSDNLDTLGVSTGSIGGLLETRTGAIDATLSSLDSIAADLIFEVNKLHSTGANEAWLTESRGTLRIEPDNRVLALNDPENTDLAELPYAPENGGFFVNVRNEDTGNSDQIFIPVDLDGIDSTGLPGTADDTTAEDIRAALDSVSGLSAGFDESGRLSITADTGFSYAFSDDSSGVLATLGVNSFLTGTDASSIGVSEDSEILLGRVGVDGSFNANANALRISELAGKASESLGGRSVTRFWADHAQDIAVQSGSARTQADADKLVRENLESQRAAVSGVSVDEESINMLTYQRQYQGAAQVITATQEMFDTLIALV